MEIVGYSTQPDRLTSLIARKLLAVHSPVSIESIPSLEPRPSMQIATTAKKSAWKAWVRG